MLKILIVTLNLSVFAMTAIAGHAQAQPGYPQWCVKAPNDQIQCPK